MLILINANPAEALSKGTFVFWPWMDQKEKSPTVHRKIFFGAGKYILHLSHLSRIPVGMDDDIQLTWLPRKAVRVEPSHPARFPCAETTSFPNEGEDVLPKFPLT